MPTWRDDRVAAHAAANARTTWRTVADWLALVIVAVSPTVAAVGCGGLCRRESSETAGLFDDLSAVQAIEEPEVRQIKGGPTVALLSYDESPLTAVQIWSPHGAADEPPGSEGIAGVCAEMFCGRLSAPDGIELSIWAAHDMTVCEFSAPRSMGETLTSHIGRLLHGVGSLSRRERLEARCRMAEERWRRSRADPSRILVEGLFHVAFGEGHPYHNPVLAPPRCEQLDVEQIAETCGPWFSSRDVVVTAAGDLSPDRLSAAFSHLPDDETPPIEPRLTKNRSKRPGILVTTSNIAKGHVALSFELSSAEARDIGQATLLLRLLLANQPRPLGGANHKGSNPRRDGFIFTGRHGGLLVITESTRPEAALPTTMELMVDALSMRSTPPSESLLAVARQEALQRHQRARSGAPRLARALGMDLIVGGDADLSSKVRRSIARARRGDLTEAAKRLFDRRGLSLSVLLPEHLKSAPSTLPVVSDDAGEARVDVARLSQVFDERLTRLFADDFSPSWTEHAGGVRSIRSPNGAVLIVRQERFSSQVVARASYSLSELDIDVVPGALASLRESISQASARAAAARSSVSRPNVPHCSNTLSVEGLFLRGDTHEGLGLVVDTLTSPLVDGGARETNLELSLLDATGDSYAMGRLAIRETLYPREPWLGESMGLIQRPFHCDEDDLEQLHAQIISSRPLVISVVGPVEPDEVYRDFLAAIVAHPIGDEGESQPIAPQNETTPPPRRVALERREIRRVVESDAHIVWFVFPIFDISDEERDVLEVLATLLGTHNGQPWRRWVDEGVASDLGVETRIGHDVGHLAISVMTTPTNEQSIRRDLSAILGLASSPVTDYEVEQARQIAAAGAARALSSVSERAAALERAHLAGLPLSWFLEAPSRILEVDSSDVHRLAQRLLIPDHLLTVVVEGEPHEEPTADEP